MSKLTPYDTGQRAEPRPWQAHHRETEADFGKVDFDAEDGFTLATLWIGSRRSAPPPTSSTSK